MTGAAANCRGREARGRRRILALVFLGVAATVFPARAVGQAPPAPDGERPVTDADRPPRVRRIALPGAEQIGRGEILDGMRLSERSWWNPLRRNYFYGLDYLELDLQRIQEHYRQEGFLLARIVDAQVDYPSREWVDLTIRVEEGPRFHVRGARLEGVSGELQQRLADRIKLRVGDPVRESAIQGDVLRLTEACSDRGHALAQVRRELRLTGDSAEVIYDLDVGPLVRVGTLTATGQTRTAPDVILREVVLKKGDPLRLARAERSQDRLFDLGVFRSVQIVPRYEGLKPDSAGTTEVTVDLDVVVQEKPPGWFGAGFGYSSRDRLRLSGEWGYRNLGGRARRLQIGGEISYSLLEEPGQRFKRPKAWQVEVSFDAPWMLGTPTRWQLRPYVEHTRWFEQTVAVEEDVIGVALRGRWDLTRYRWLLGSLENKWTTQDSTFVTRFISLSIAEDKRDFILDPRGGHLNQFGAEYAGGILGGEAEFARWTLGLSGYVPMGSGFVWARRIRAGYIHPYRVARGQTDLASVPISERYFTGGGTSVRGYADESLGPRLDGQSQGGLVLLVVNAEVRFPLFWRLGGVVFLDAGNVWADYRDLTWSCLTRSWSASGFNERDVAYGVGAGLRFSTPVGPIRLDYAVEVGQGYRDASGQDSEWHLNLGHAF